MSLYPGVALITGAASGKLLSPTIPFPSRQTHPNLHSPGISQATAVSFAREGCTKLVLADRDEAGLARTQQLIAQVAGEGKAAAIAVKTDVTSAEQVEALFQRAVAEFGRVDYAVNGAGENPRITNPSSADERFTDVRKAS